MNREVVMVPLSLTVPQTLELLANLRRARPEVDWILIRATQVFDWNSLEP